MTLALFSKKLGLHVGSELIEDATYAGLAQAISRGSLVLAAMILAGGLQIPEFAAYAYFQLTVNMLAGYAGLGVGVTAAKCFALVSVAPEKARDDIAALWLITFFSAVAVAAVAFLLGDFILGEGTRIPRMCYSVAIATIVVGVVPAGGINGLEAFRESLALSVIVGLVTIAGAFIARWAESLEIAVWTLTLAFLVRSVGDTLITLARTGWPKLNWGKNRLHAALQRVLAMIGPMALVSLLAASGVWIVGRIVLDAKGDLEFAQYAIGMQWYALGLFVPSILARIVFARQVRMGMDELEASGEHRMALLHRGIRLSFTGSILVVLVGVATGPFIVRFYGPHYAKEAWLVSGFLLASTFVSSANLVGNALVARNRQGLWLLLTIVWAILLISSALAMNRMGCVGAAVSFGGSGLILFGLAYMLVRRSEAAR